jgi:hypothetical protein
LPIVAEPWPGDLGTLVPSGTSDVRPPPPFPFCCSANLLVLVTGILAGTGLWCTLVHWYHWYQWGEAPSGIWFALWPYVLVLFVALICLTGLCCCLWMLVWSELIVAMNWFLSACLTLAVSVVGFLICAIGCLLFVPIGCYVNSLVWLVVVLYWYSCCYSCAVCVYLYPCCLYHDGCMAVLVTGTALDLALLLLFVICCLACAWSVEWGFVIWAVQMWPTLMLGWLG